MRRISANYIYPVNTLPLKNGIVEVDNTGKIVNIIDTKGNLRESRNLEFYNGVIIPGLINAHCHLELSGLKGLVKKNVGLPAFLSNIINYKRNGSENIAIKAIENNDKAMSQNGIVAVGDISNTNQTVLVKTKSKIQYHTFIEAIGLSSNSDEIFREVKRLYEDFYEKNLRVSVSPHAPYSVSRELFQQIKNFAEQKKSVISIHNQETKSENQLFKSKSGELAETFLKIGIDLKQWKITGKNSVQSISEYLPVNNNVLFVHNTYSMKEDVMWVNEHLKHAYWCLCPNSNLYIENKLPDINLFRLYSNQVTIGTDSLASNTTLSILEEMKTLVQNFENLEFSELIKWGTLNGAKALKMDDKLGSIEIGKTPGLNLISNFNFDKMQISEKSEIKVLI